MIIKIQMSLMTNAGRPQALMYNKDRSALLEIEATKDIQHLMHGRPKAFFHAEIVDTKFVISHEAKWQNW